MLLGVAYALLAGLLWGLVFIAPLLLPEYPATVLSVGRYLAFGLIALPLALADRTAVRTLTRADWIEATRLSLVGNLVYYGFLAAAIQAAGAPLPTMIIGTLPVVIAVCSNLSEPELPWRKLALSLGVIAAGIALVDRDELIRLASHGEDPRRLLVGAALAAGAVACWTWYPIRNARWLHARPALRSGTWATAQGLTTLPLAMLGGVALTGWFAVQRSLASPPAFDWPLGPRPAIFVAAMLAIGLGASWLGTLCWNRASQLLPTSLAGQLIVFETLAALLYAFAWRGQLPGPGTFVGIGLMVAGVLIGIRAFRSSAAARGAAKPASGS